MSRIELLNPVDHHDLKVKLGHGRAWGDAVNQALVFPTEYEELQREYAIIVRKEADGRFQSVALLGLDAGENLYLDGRGGWNARYVPASRRIAPFKLGPSAPALDGGETGPMAHVDLDHPRASRQEGAPLFLPHGGRAPYLEHMLRILRGVHVGLEISDPMFEAFVAHDLLEPMRLQITVDDDLRYDVPDAWTVGAERLGRLDGGALEALHRAGFLRLAVMLTSSLANIGRLIDLKGAARQAPPAQDASQGASKGAAARSVA